MGKNSLFKAVLVSIVVGVAVYAYGDVVPYFGPMAFPRMGDFPLHRIGLEFVLTSVAAALGGGFITKWLVKRGWKFEKDVTQEERREIEGKLIAALPKLLRCVVANRLFDSLTCSHPEQKDEFEERKNEIELLLLRDPILTKELEGVPIEWIASRLQEELTCLTRQSASNNSLGYGLDNEAYWASLEEMEKWKEENWTNEQEKWRDFEKWIERKRQKELVQYRRRLALLLIRLALLLILLPVIIWFAWWLGQNI